MSIATVILAAGKGTRMNSDIPKVLHPIAGAPMLVHALQAARSLEPAGMVVVAGHGAEAVTQVVQEYDEETQVVVQDEQLGTGHAVQQARAALDGFDGTVIVLYADTPFVRPETLQAMIDARSTQDVVVLGFEATDPGRYGRLKMAGETLEAIVEFNDATEAERAITLCNSGVVACDAATLFSLLDAVTNDNAAGEYYLTDIIGLARARGLSAGVVTCPQAETLGINSRAELAAADALFQQAARATAMEDGVTLLDPASIYFAYDTVIGRDTVIEPHVFFGPEVTIESGARIRAFSHLEGCHVARGGVVGPYARLRPGAELSEDVRVGNFVEIKNATIDAGAKVNHLSYIGDAFVGAGANIGAGTITCNYDGVLKHHTHIGARAFIGSNTMLVAPVSIGNEAMTASGSVITSDVEDGALAIARAHQTEKPGMARKLMQMLRAKKARQTRGN
ncbi:MULTISPECIES: bifunctional UDP-N-acetylglucosamine diphosphorylase/glucosamine-1-phosphate N-acetyltransferase GlmU [Roseobacteraceae]|uniref:Bifunctional protein GlmU n=1 Tax=Pseudosulfitobacter pseudonitzschiae TaxID=1402135 RepID=A0A221K134_9RHOB|nr:MULTISPECIES: bifunctional UDP-N-acetylglucosamine diphosphorylase/glucosamine-1-phosphate N-acetyltransferase GlmU [Roseobacteraceae]ASM72694.1 bifunctional protein GlmU [Pseudosulfitobacter pseudonitzschiae]